MAAETRTPLEQKDAREKRLGEIQRSFRAAMEVLLNSDEARDAPSDMLEAICLASAYEGHQRATAFMRDHLWKNGWDWKQHKPREGVVEFPVCPRIPTS